MRRSVTDPRHIVRGQCVSSEKFSLDRQARFRPDPEVVQIVLYTMGVWADRYGIQLHEFCITPDRECIECTDPQGNRSPFFQQTRAFTARALNRLFGERDKVYSGQEHTEPELVDGHGRLESCVETLVAPIAAALVRYGWDWPMSSWNLEYGIPMTIKRPRVFFRPKSWPDSIDIVLRPPPDTCQELEPRELRAEIRAQARRRQGELLAELRARGSSLLGMKRARRLERHRRLPVCRPGRLRDRHACGACPSTVALAKARYLRFIRDHADARRQRLAGNRDWKFPHGTYLARVVYGVPCHDPDP